MGLIGWAAVGIVIGAAGSEVLRTCKRDLVEKVEKAAARFVEALLPSKTDDAEARNEGDEASKDA